MFLTTLSFLVTTPGVWEPSLGGFPALSTVPGQFLIKDLALLGISLWTLGEACGRGRSALTVRQDLLQETIDAFLAPCHCLRDHSTYHRPEGPDGR
jgi:Protein of unknown function, DUF417